MEPEKKNKCTADQDYHGFGLEVILTNPFNNPWCAHGPTLLFSRKVKDQRKRFYACAAQRKRKFCDFYLLEGDTIKNRIALEQKIKAFIENINHEAMFANGVTSKTLKPFERIYCSTCCYFVLQNLEKHVNHNLLRGISDYQFINPTAFLPPLETNETEAQYWFSKSAVENIVEMLKSLKYRYVYRLVLCC